MPTPSHQVTSDDVGPAVNVMSWFLISTTFLAVALRGLTKSFVTSRITNDDLLILLSLLLAIGIAVTDSIQVANGLGQRITTLTIQQQNKFQQASYAGDLLHILVLVFSKMSILYFYKMLTPVPAHWRIIKTALPVLAVWGASSFLVAAFQCQAPRVWDYLGSGKCLNRMAFLTYFSVSNMVIEVVLVTFPIYIIMKIQTNTSKKMLLASCFLARVLVVAALIAEITTRARANVSYDPTFNYWPVVISQQLTHSLAIITACIPYYVSWVPHAFRIYASTYSNHAARLWKRENGGGMGHGPLNHFEMTLGRGESRSLHGVSVIKKTVETDVHIETASANELLPKVNIIPPRIAMSRQTTRYGSSDQSSILRG